MKRLCLGVDHAHASQRQHYSRGSAHIPNKHQVMTRCYGYYAIASAGHGGGAVPDVPPPVEPMPVALSEARRRGLAVLADFDVDPTRGPACGSAMRVVAFITQRTVIDGILAHMRRTREFTFLPFPGPTDRRRWTAPASERDALAQSSTMS